MMAAFVTTWRSLWRGRTLMAILALTAAAHFLLPGLVRSDGTIAGMLEMHVRLVCGAIAAIVYVSALAIACGSFSKDREDDLLPLLLVRPASAFSVALGRWLAIMGVLAAVLALNAVLLNATLSRSAYAPGDCWVHYSPALPPANVTAAKMMDGFLKSDKTPEAVKKAPRAALLSLLTSKENERYEVVRPGKSISLPFNVPGHDAITARVRFSTLYNIKEALCGHFAYRASSGAVSNSTQSVLNVPLKPDLPPTLTLAEPTLGRLDGLGLSFRNEGASDVMFRPRRDIVLMVRGDSFLMNSVRASVEVLSLAGLLTAFGLFLSAALSRPVAIFTAAVLLAAALMAPDAVSQFPDEFNATLGERLGLAISRMVSNFTSALSEVSPVSDLASGKAIAIGELVRSAVRNLIVWPALFFALSAFVLRRRAS